MARNGCQGRPQNNSWMVKNAHSAGAQAQSFWLLRAICSQYHMWVLLPPQWRGNTYFICASVSSYSTWLLTEAISLGLLYISFSYLPFPGLAVGGRPHIICLGEGEPEAPARLRAVFVHVAPPGVAGWDPAQAAPAKGPALKRPTRSKHWDVSAAPQPNLSKSKPHSNGIL